MMKITLIGMTSCKLGGMEFANLGNYTIMEPLMRGLEKEIPESRIFTSIQMSEGFCKRYGIVCLRGKRFWSYAGETAIETLADIFRIGFWLVIKVLFRKDAGSLLKKSQLLSVVKSSDLVIDFSGDIFGDNARPSQFLEGCAEILFAKLLAKPVIMLAGSPGPFRSFWRKKLAKHVFNKVDLITNREPVSTDLLLDIGVEKEKIRTTACPAFLFEGKPKETGAEVLREEGVPLDGEKPLVGVILCGWNMPTPPFNKVPRKEEELSSFCRVITHLLGEKGCRVILMSHQNKIRQDGSMAKGTDHIILEQIYYLLKNKGWGNSLFILNGVYDAALSKAIIGNFNILISGRIHGAISGLSQCVPTSIIDYGHEPKAHKLKGFARLVGIEEYLCDPSEPEDMIEKVNRLMSKSDEVRTYLEKRIPEIKKRSMSNFELVKNFYNKA
ncbi:MAG: polysaccharide pyruvyl transferase family protein [Candidatus Omnitrophica bacterium]|nr:polysaccharide pyruvyl transferase family protein [Candidatus Omnitrophota bacterium]